MQFHGHLWIKILIKCPTCYKSIDSLAYIYMYLTNKTSSFQNRKAIEMGLSDFHLMILTVLKSGFVKRGPRIVVYRYYSKFDPISFQSDIKNNLAGDNKACLVFKSFNSIVEELMSKHAPIKQKYLRANDDPS